MGEYGWYREGESGTGSVCVWVIQGRFKRYRVVVFDTGRVWALEGAWG
jgi:hypothetical protein